MSTIVQKVTKMIIRKYIQSVLVLACTFVVSGCVSGFAIQADNMTQIGPDPLMNSRLIEEIDIIELLSPSSFTVNREPKAITRRLFGKSKREPVEKNLTIEEAYEGLSQSLAGAPQYALLRRNEIQDRIVAASNQRCGAYIQRLKQFDAETNLQLGFLTTAFATAGAIFSAESTIRASSGLAAFLSGFRAEFNQEYFSNQTVHIIAEGIGSRRREILNDIYELRQKASVRDYTIWAAIADGITYHENCSLVAGLEQVARAVERVDNPGLKQMVKVFNELGAIQSGMTNLPRLASSGLSVLAGAASGAQSTGDEVDFPQAIYFNASKALADLSLQVISPIAPAAPTLKLKALPSAGALAVINANYPNPSELAEANTRMTNLKNKITAIAADTPTLTAEVNSVIAKYSTTFNPALTSNDQPKLINAQDKLPSLKAGVKLADSSESKLKAEWDLKNGQAELKFYFDKYMEILTVIQAASAKVELKQKEVFDARKLAEEFGFDNS